MRSLFVILMLLVSAARAHAEGWLVGGSIGPGFSAGRLGWDGPSAPFAPPGQPAPPPGHVEQDDLGTYLALSGDLRVGRAISSRVVLSGELEGTVLRGFDSALLGWTTYDNAVGVAASVIAEWRLARFTISGGAGGAFTTFGGSRADIGAPDNVADFDSVIGGVAKLAVGSWISRATRAEVELRAGYLAGEHLSYVPVTLTLRLRFGAL